MRAGIILGVVCGMATCAVPAASATLREVPVAVRVRADGVLTIDGRTYPRAQGLQVIGNLCAAGRRMRIEPANAAFKMVGSLIYAMQQGGCRKIAFTSEPPPVDEQEVPR